GLERSPPQQDVDRPRRGRDLRRRAGFEGHLAGSTGRTDALRRGDRTQGRVPAFGAAAVVPSPQGCGHPRHCRGDVRPHAAQYRRLALTATGQGGPRSGSSCQGRPVPTYWVIDEEEHPMADYGRTLTAEQENHLSIGRAMAEKQAPYTAALLDACRYVNVPGLETLGAVDPRLLVFLDVDL